MQPAQSVSAVVDAVMERIQNEYADLKKSTNYSLSSLFDSNQFHFEQYCQDFQPHPQMAELKKNTIDFGNQYDILLNDAEQYITCAMFLFPTAPMEKIVLLSKNYAVDFYLNDTMGRDAKPTTEEQQRLYAIRDRLAARGKELNPDGDASFAEVANIKVLEEIANTSPASWFNEFLHQYLYHIDVAHRSYDAATLGYIPSVEEYVTRRCYISGMPHSVSLVEYSNNVFLDWDRLDKAGWADDLKKIGWTVSLIGALTNDLFSFEKEVIDHRSDSNLVVLIVLNNFRMTLEEAIHVAASIIRRLLDDYHHYLFRIQERMATGPGIEDQQKEYLRIWLDGVKAVLQACWTWQTFTKRYKRAGSIWQETAATGAVPIQPAAFPAEK